MIRLSQPCPESLNQLRWQRVFTWNAINAMAWNGLKDIELYESLWHQWHRLRQAILLMEQQEQ